MKGIAQIQDLLSERGYADDAADAARAQVVAEERRMMPHSARPPKLTRPQIDAVLRFDGRLRCAASLGVQISTMRALWRRGIVELEIGPDADMRPCITHRYALTPHGAWVRAKLQEVAP